MQIELTGEILASQVHPTLNRVLVKRMARKERSDGGIFLPDEAQEKVERGIVVAVGPGRILPNGERGEMDLQFGDMVWLDRTAGTDLQIEGREYVILRRIDIMMQLEVEDGN